MLEIIASTVDRPIVRAGLGLLGLVFAAVLCIFLLALLYAASPDATTIGIGGCLGLAGGLLRVLFRTPTLRRRRILRKVTLALLVTGTVTAATLVFDWLAPGGSYTWRAFICVALIISMMLLLATIPSFWSGPDSSFKPGPLREPA
ncbi:hypothetical protein ACTJIL_02575 [Luteimonas sp. 22616]|jgi:hypothetical protein|uniref:hypothetical protein n=1 Tax=Luteimonas sp. 22616 TaxID=3453951 RepID=UPI003F833694